MTNEEYVARWNASEETKQKCLAVMEKYGDNKWWLSEDARIVGYYQLLEDFLLVGVVSVRVFDRPWGLHTEGGLEVGFGGLEIPQH